MDKTVQNKYGVIVNVCCASCEHCHHEAVDYAGVYRKCKMFYSIVKADDSSCKGWQMSSMFTDLAPRKDPGHVKRQRYLKMVARVREKENKFKVKEEDCISNDDLRLKYETKYMESVYIDHQL